MLDSSSFDFQELFETSLETPAPAQEIEELSSPSGSSEQPTTNKSLAEKVAQRIKRSAKTYLQNLNPKDKTWAWRMGAVGSTGLSAFLGLHTGGASILLKSAVTSAASLGAHFVEKGIYSLKEKKLVKEFTGEELAEKIVQLQAKHAKGVDRIAKFFGGISAGSVYGGIIGMGDLTITHPLPSGTVELQTNKFTLEKISSVRDQLQHTSLLTDHPLPAPTPATETIIHAGEKLKETTSTHLPEQVSTLQQPSPPELTLPDASKVLVQTELPSAVSPSKRGARILGSLFNSFAYRLHRKNGKMA